MKTKNSHHSVPKSHRYMSHFANVALSGVEVQNTKCPSPFTRGSWWGSKPFRRRESNNIAT